MEIFNNSLIFKHMKNAISITDTEFDKTSCVTWKHPVTFFNCFAFLLSSKVDNLRATQS